MPRTTGSFVETTTAGETVRAFVPRPLPPEPPPAEAPELTALLQQATARLSELRVASHLVLNPDLFNYAFVRKEAILSSQIEGVQATLTDLLNYEADPEQASADLQEVCNYLDALQFGRKQLGDPKGLPLSLRLIKEMHKRLMKGRSGRFEATWRVSKLPELDRRDEAEQCPLCTASTRRDAELP